MIVVIRKMPLYDVAIVGFFGANCEMSNETSTETPMTTTSGTCVPTDSCDGGHYTCNNDTGEKVCNPGFKGTDCKERDVQGDDLECPTLGTCKNGGNCWNHTCCCAKGYEGLLCGSDIIECLSSPCVNGGICTEGGIGEYKCKCPAGKYQ